MSSTLIFTASIMYRFTQITSAPIGAWEVKLESMTDQPANDEIICWCCARRTDVSMYVMRSVMYSDASKSKKRFKICICYYLAIAYLRLDQDLPLGMKE